MNPPLRHESDSQDRNPLAGIAAPVSVVILTFNEFDNLSAALDSCAWCKDVVVLDSGSTDGTIQIAEERGVRIYENSFESFGKQRNWAIENIPLDHEWVFHLDADEHFTAPLVKEMAWRIAQASDELAGYHVPHKLMLHNQWLRRSGGYPVYQMRLFHKHRMQFIDHGHGQREAPGSITEKLNEPYLHFAFSKGLEDWLAKHNRYALHEAQEFVNSNSKLQWSELFSTDGLKRRRALKNISYHVPLRPTLRWWMIVAIQRGILDGRAGLTYAAMLSTYERMFGLHVRAIRSNLSVAGQRKSS